MPTLVYEYNFPRTNKIRPKFLISKIITSILCILIGYILVSDHVVPYIEMSNKISGLELLFRIIMPCALLYLIAFYITFELIL